MTSSGAVEEMHLDQLTALFRLLSDKTRLNILLLLAAGERNVTSLCEDLKLPQPTVSHHLGLLRTSNVLGNRRNGKQVFYQLNGRVDREQMGDLAIHADNYIVTIRRAAGGAVSIANVQAPESTPQIDG